MAPDPLKLQIKSMYVHVCAASGDIIPGSCSFLSSGPCAGIVNVSLNVSYILFTHCMVSSIMYCISLLILRNCPHFTSYVLLTVRKWYKTNPSFLFKPSELSESPIYGTLNTSVPVYCTLKNYVYSNGKTSIIYMFLRLPSTVIYVCVKPWHYCFVTSP